MKLFHFRCFLTALEHGSLVRAAKVLGVSQPALSNNIAVLESHFGVELFERAPRGVISTVFGRILADHARTLILATDRATIEMEHVANGTRGHLILGAALGYADVLVPRLLTELTLPQSGITVSVTTGFNDELIERLRAGEFDALVCGYRSDTNMMSDIVIEPLASGPVSLYVRRGHPLAETKRVTPKMLAAHRWVLAETPTAKENLGIIFGEDRFSVMERAIRSTSVALIKELVIQTGCVTLLPEFFLVNEIKSGLLKRVDFVLPRGTFLAGVLYRRDWPISQAFQKFLELARIVAPKVLR